MRRTRLGGAITAVSFDREAAALSGIDIAACMAFAPLISRAPAVMAAKLFIPGDARLSAN